MVKVNIEMTQAEYDACISSVPVYLGNYDFRSFNAAGVKKKVREDYGHHVARAVIGDSYLSQHIGVDVSITVKE